jgi:hypothetical protein
MPEIVACAVVHGDPPTVFLAEDMATLNWVLALRLVAQVPAEELRPGLREALRESLLAEQWGEAVEMWMSRCQDAVDVYPSYDCYVAAELELAAQELQFSPLFRDP